MCDSPGGPTMKRGPAGGNANYDGAGSMKRPRGDKFETRVLVPSKVAGSIIGKAGCNIQKLRTDNDANVRIPDCPGPERVMTVLTADTISAAKVLEQSMPFMTEEAVRGGSQGALTNAGHANSEDAIELRLLIHQSIVGGIIGRGGFKIKEIREHSGAGIKVYQTCAPQSTDRCVSIQGTPAKIFVALGDVFNVVEDTEIKGVDQPYDPINFDGYYASEYGGYGGGNEEQMGFNGGGGGDRGGFGGGGRGGTPRGGGGERGRGGFRGGRGFDNGFRGGRGSGSQRGFGRGGRGGFDQGFGGYDQAFGGGRGGGGGGGGFQGHHDQGFAGGNFAPSSGGNGGIPSLAQVGEDSGEVESTQVTIPKDMAGAIIGPGGSRIRKIRNDAKATITIDEVPPGATERIITITGTKRQIQTAQYLLQQSVRDNSGPTPSHGGY